MLMKNNFTLIKIISSIYYPFILRMSFELYKIIDMFTPKLSPLNNTQDRWKATLYKIRESLTNNMDVIVQTNYPTAQSVSQLKVSIIEMCSIVFLMYFLKELAPIDPTFVEIFVISTTHVYSSHMRHYISKCLNASAPQILQISIDTTIDSTNSIYASFTQRSITTLYNQNKPNTHFIFMMSLYFLIRSHHTKDFIFYVVGPLLPSIIQTITYHLCIYPMLFNSNAIEHFTESEKKLANKTRIDPWLTYLWYYIFSAIYIFNQHHITTGAGENGTLLNLVIHLFIYFAPQVIISYAHCRFFLKNNPTINFFKPEMKNFFNNILYFNNQRLHIGLLAAGSLAHAINTPEILMPLLVPITSIAIAHPFWIKNHRLVYAYIEHHLTQDTLYYMLIKHTRTAPNPEQTHVISPSTSMPLILRSVHTLASEIAHDIEILAQYWALVPYNPYQTPEEEAHTISSIYSHWGKLREILSKSLKLSHIAQTHGLTRHTLIEAEPSIAGGESYTLIQNKWSYLSEQVQEKHLRKHLPVIFDFLDNIFDASEEKITTEEEEISQRKHYEYFKNALNLLGITIAYYLLSTLVPVMSVTWCLALFFKYKYVIISVIIFMYIVHKLMHSIMDHLNIIKNAYFNCFPSIFTKKIFSDHIDFLIKILEKFETKLENPNSLNHATWLDIIIKTYLGDNAHNAFLAIIKCYARLKIIYIGCITALLTLALTATFFLIAAHTSYPLTTYSIVLLAMGIFFTACAYILTLKTPNKIPNISDDYSNLIKNACNKNVFAFIYDIIIFIKLSNFSYTKGKALKILLLNNPTLMLCIPAMLYGCSISLFLWTPHVHIILAGCAFLTMLAMMHRFIYDTFLLPALVQVQTCIPCLSSLNIISGVYTMLPKMSLFSTPAPSPITRP